MGKTIQKSTKNETSVSKCKMLKTTTLGLKYSNKQIFIITNHRFNNISFSILLNFALSMMSNILC